MHFSKYDAWKGRNLLFDKNFSAPRAHQSRDSILIPLGVDALISLQQTRLELSNVNSCADKSDKNIEFSMESCALDCFGREVELHCNCSLIGFSRTTKGIPSCSPRETFRCYERYRQVLRNRRDQCQARECTPPCKQAHSKLLEYCKDLCIIP